MPLQRPHEHLNLGLHKHLVNVYEQQAGFKFVHDIVQLTPLSMPTSIVNAPLLCVVESRIAILYQIGLVR